MSATSDRDLGIDGADEQEMPTQVLIPMVGANKILMLVEENLDMKNTMANVSNTMTKKCTEMFNWYQKLKESSRRMNSAFAQTQIVVSEQSRTITILKAEKIQLQHDLNARKLQRLEIGDTEKKGDKDEISESELVRTVNALHIELKKALKEKKEIEQRFMDYETDCTKWGAQLEIFFKLREEKLLADCGAQIQVQQIAYATMEQESKERVLTLENKIQELQTTLDERETDVENWKYEVEIKEGRICQLNQLASDLEEQKRIMNEKTVSLEQDLKEVQQRKITQEESFHQLLARYNEEHEKNRRVELELNGKTQELDKVGAENMAAEETISEKIREIAGLKDRMGVAECQATIYKHDFEIERVERLKLHGECVQLHSERQQMKEELMRYQAAGQYATRPR